MSHLIDLSHLTYSAEVEERVNALELPFGPLGYDPFGISKQHLKLFYSVLEPFYRSYFRVEVSGIEHVPSEGRAMLIGNHSGGVPVDAGMLFASIFFELNPPRHAHGMVEKFAQNLPFLSSLFSRIGQLTGLPEHAEQLLESERLLLAFPEGVRGTGKLYRDRYKLARFGTGFMRIALVIKSLIVPFAFIGGEEAMPVIYHAQTLADLIGVPYIPIPKHIIPIPKPEYCGIIYGEPLYFEGSGNERDVVIQGYVDQVRDQIAQLIETGRARRQIRIEEAERERSRGLTGGGLMKNLIPTLSSTLGISPKRDRGSDQDHGSFDSSQAIREDQS
jgi:1-acyl-sn-glycerol-3-phosphate acyltransferase